MTQFTLVDAVIGGAVLSVAALMMLLFNGKITGISGIIYGLKQSFSKSGLWRFCFILGLIISPFFASHYGYVLPDTLNMSWLTMVIGGLLVGFGTQLGSGCTSGHGICGIGRLSIRSIVATCIFIGTAVITVFLIKLF